MTRKLKKTAKKGRFRGKTTFLALNSPFWRIKGALTLSQQVFPTDHEVR